MTLKVAKTAGFCMGVQRAIEMVLKEANQHKGPLFTFGPLIHNRQVLHVLEGKGAQVVDRLEDLLALKAGTVVIRAHGIPPEELAAIRRTGLRIVNATCPRVAQVQAVIRRQTRKGGTCVIVGDADHSEVRGLVGYAGGKAHVIRSVAEVEGLPALARPFVVAQTTQNEAVFRQVVAALQRRFPEIEVFNTICNATRLRQEEVTALAGEMDAMVVVGGLHSANTQRLAQIARESGLETLHVETEADLDPGRLAGKRVIGVTAGASTPNWMIENVVHDLALLQAGGEPAMRRWLRAGLRFGVLSHLVSAFGALAFAFAVATVLRGTCELVYPAIAFLYVFAMHTFSMLFDMGSNPYKDPDRTRLLAAHKGTEIVAGALAIVLAIVLAYKAHIWAFWSVLTLSVLGLAYNSLSLPSEKGGSWHGLRFHDLPGFRSLAEPVAWTLVIALIPALGLRGELGNYLLLAAPLVLILSFCRRNLLDTLRIQGDLVSGRATIPILLGERRTLPLLKATLGAGALLLILTVAAGWASVHALAFLPPVGGLAACIVCYQRRWVYPWIWLEALVESNFVLAGLLALIFC